VTGRFPVKLESTLLIEILPASRLPPVDWVKSPPVRVKAPLTVITSSSAVKVPPEISRETAVRAWEVVLAPALRLRILKAPLPLAIFPAPVNSTVEPPALKLPVLVQSLATVMLLLLAVRVPAMVTSRATSKASPAVSRLSGLLTVKSRATSRADPWVTAPSITTS
jgi:hypothetical protein